MDDHEGMSLKEVLLDVSKKLDRFLEAHAVLHTDMALREARVEIELSSHKELREKVEELDDWKTEAQGQLKLIKWAVGGGMLGAAGLILRLLGVPLP